jgi:hypothetical protein
LLACLECEHLVVLLLAVDRQVRHLLTVAEKYELRVTHARR